MRNSHAVFAVEPLPYIFVPMILTGQFQESTKKPGASRQARRPHGFGSVLLSECVYL